MGSSQTSIITLYREHHGWLHHWLCGKLECSHSAADLAQDTFVRLLRRKRGMSVSEVEQPRAYLRVIANGLVIDYYRRRSLERAYLEALAQMPEPESVSPEEREALLETLDRIDAMLDRLPERIRQAFLMSQLEGVSYSDIALLLRVSVRTVKRDMKHAFTRCLALMVEE
ncbi:sigma-70 family RNA polymerase sigma factor [Marinobacter sp. ATCH36]|uniref:sigma-70 family RNA polymerase sigma factor n=1 Tax=Marinobacter sp. ATCH36 TaxID=2945106 RepID=UPI0020227204|nr:sigma-70 family RNA polymerase sigma factor [Marinobacter sp. ATCH36]MCL7942450.1 sigma-70 family RNA polymerase sigma factor [Marinobacter sp. ATCH36]